MNGQRTIILRGKAYKHHSMQLNFAQRNFKDLAALRANYVPTLYSSPNDQIR